MDAGLSAKETLARIERAGLDAGQIGAVLITHEHGDHVRGLDVLARRLDVPVYATEGTLRDFLVHRRTSDKSIDNRTVRYNEPLSVGCFAVRPFATSHDANEPCGYIVSENGQKLGYCPVPALSLNRCSNCWLSATGWCLKATIAR